MADGRLDAASQGLVSSVSFASYVQQMAWETWHPRRYLWCTTSKKPSAADAW